MVIPEMTPAELVRRLEDQQEIHVLDIRMPHQLADGRVDLVPDSDFHNIPVAEFRIEADAHDIELQDDKQYAVVCTRGNDSKKVTEYLNKHGYNAASMRGGMFAWMEVAVPRELEPPEGFDAFIQFDRIGKGALGYVLISDGEAFIIDPPRHTTEYLQAVDAADAKIVGVADTHAHADYISGGPNLAIAFSAPYYLHPADAVYPYDGTPGKIRYVPVEEGTTIPVGRGKIHVIHTPGHTEGSVTYLAGNAAMTGDFLFIKTVGRPDLGEQTGAWTGVLFDSLERARLECPPEQRICPAHYSDPEVERNPDRTIVRTFGELCKSNAQLAMKDRQEFTDWVAARAGSFPEQYKTIKAVNVGLEQVSDEEMNELEAGKNQCALG